jgi:hypothetical protein
LRSARVTLSTALIAKGAAGFSALPLMPPTLIVEGSRVQGSEFRVQTPETSVQDQ